MYIFIKIIKYVIMPISEKIKYIYGKNKNTHTIDGAKK